MSIRPVKNATRASNIELLRIVLMLMIIGFHFIIHGAGMGGGLSHYSTSNEGVVGYVFLKSFTVMAVNCFVFISGYYRIKFKVNTLINLAFQVLFYSFLFTLLADALSLQEVSIGTYIYAIFPLFSGMWWFITAYVALYLLSPLLNTAVDTFSKQTFLLMIISLTIINSFCDFIFNASSVGAHGGLSVISFVHIYLLAQFIKKYINPDTLERYSLPVYLGSSLLIFVLALLSIRYSSESGIVKIFMYNNPLVLLSAISFFFCFKRLKLQNRLINSISPCVLGIYLFHDHPLMRDYLIEPLYKLSLHPSVLIHFLNIFCFTLLVFFAGYVLEMARSYITAPIAKFSTQKFKQLRVDKMLAYQNSK